MATTHSLITSPAGGLQSLRGEIIDARIAYPEVLHVELRDREDRVWCFATQDADWVPFEIDQLVGQEVREAVIDPDTSALRCRLSGGAVFEVLPAPQADPDDPPNWELIAPDSSTLVFGPGRTWRVCAS